MKSNILTFRDKYYEYGRSEDKENKGLAIGGYESAFLADLVVSYIMEKTKGHFKKSKFRGIYRDDGIVAWEKKMSKKEIVNWLR